MCSAVGAYLMGISVSERQRERDRERELDDNRPFRELDCREISRLARSFAKKKFIRFDKTAKSRWNAALFNLHQHKLSLVFDEFIFLLRFFFVSFVNSYAKRLQRRYYLAETLTLDVVHCSIHRKKSEAGKNYSSMKWLKHKMVLEANTSTIENVTGNSWCRRSGPTLHSR